MSKESVDLGMVDAADYMSTVLMYAFPDIHIEEFKPRPHRLGLKITLPVQSEFEISEVDEFAFTFMQQLYLMSDCRYLIAYTVERERDEDDDGD